MVQLMLKFQVGFLDTFPTSTNYNIGFNVWHLSFTVSSFKIRYRSITPDHQSNI